MIDVLKLRVNKLIEENKDDNEKYKIIKEILDKNDCFSNMNIEYAYAILKDLGVPNDKLKDVYIQLI